MKLNSKTQLLCSCIILCTSFAHANTINDSNLSSLVVKIPINVSNHNLKSSINSINMANSNNYKYIMLQKLTNSTLAKANQNTPIRYLGTSDSYNVASNITDTNQFYNAKQPVLDQQGFGTCVTFASSSMLGYLENNNTSSISPLDLLLQGYKDATNKTQDSGWNGLQSARQVLDRIISNKEGYHNDYYATNQDYTNLSSQYGYTEDITPLFNSSQFTSLYNNYLQIIAYPVNIHQISNVKYDELQVAQGNTNNATTIKNALDSGQKVLIGFVVYDPSKPRGCYNGSATGDASYSYLNDTLLRNIGNGHTKNSWTNPTGCVVGGHEVMVTSYFTDSNGHTMFLIRNSWGDNTGDNGNYYMSDSYANTAIDDATVISKIHA